jgi:hypothetical protein
MKKAVSGGDPFSNEREKQDGKRQGPPSQSGLGLFGLLETLVVLALIAGFLFLTLGQRTHPIGIGDKNTRKELAQEGINTATHQTTTSDVNAKLKEAQAKMFERQERPLDVGTENNA